LGCVVGIRVTLVARVTNKNIEANSSLKEARRLALDHEAASHGCGNRLAADTQGHAEEGEEDVVVLGLIKHIFQLSPAP